jgi:hypothetical protein
MMQRVDRRGYCMDVNYIEGCEGWRDAMERWMRCMDAVDGEGTREGCVEGCDRWMVVNDE